MEKNTAVTYFVKWGDVKLEIRQYLNSLINRAFSTFK